MTAHSASPVMNDPPITPTPWKNHTPPTTTSTTATMRRIHTGQRAVAARRSASVEAAAA